MPTKNNVVLPASFLQALEKARHSPHSFMSKSGQVKCLPFIGGGAEDAGEGADDKGGESDSGESGDGKQSGTDDADKDSEDEDDEGDSEEHKGLPDNVKAILRKERNAAREARREAERAKAEAANAQQKAKEYEDRDKSDLEKAQERAAVAEKRAADLEASNKRLSLRSAFMADTSVAWVDPDDALDMAMRQFGLGDLEVSDSGRVDKKALQKILKRVADEKAYLVKKEEGSDGKQRSGAPFNGGKGGGKKEVSNEAAMRQKFPAMRGRRKTEA
jgi:hypothetical protein